MVVECTYVLEEYNSLCLFICNIECFSIYIYIYIYTFTYTVCPYIRIYVSLQYMQYTVYNFTIKHLHIFPMYNQIIIDSLNSIYRIVIVEHTHSFSSPSKGYTTIQKAITAAPLTYTIVQFTCFTFHAVNPCK